jgi:GT2 family glycosyltransferase
MSLNIISIIIVNWNGRQHLKVCLESLLNQTYKDFEVILVDNNSTDDSVNFVKSNFPQVKIIKVQKNYGFAEGNNIGIREALKNPEIKYIVALNNDTEVKSDWLQQLVDVAKRDEKIGAVSSKILFFNQRNIIDSTGDYLQPHSLKVVSRGYKQKDEGQFEKVEECFSARACAALYRRKMLEEICLNGDYFDGHYFTHIEDSDLSIRARLSGWKIVYAPKAIVYHKVAATTKRGSYLFIRYQSGRNRLFTAIKNYPFKMWPLALRERTSVETEYHLSLKDKLRIYPKILSSLLISLPRLISQRRYIQSRKKISDEEIHQWPHKFSIRN